MLEAAEEWDAAEEVALCEKSMWGAVRAQRDSRGQATDRESGK